MTAQEILKKPYHFVIYADETGGFNAYVKEFPGCVNCGDTFAETAQRIFDTAESWLEACLANDVKIPEPLADV